MTEEVKEIQMDMPAEGGARRSRKRGSGPKRSRKTRVADTEENASTVVTKDEHIPASASVPAPTVAHAPAVASPKVVLAPAKKKPAKVMLVPKGKTVVRTVPRKTFKAKRVRVTIDNTAKTQKHRTSILAKVDTMTDDQIRAAAVQARLSRRETVTKAPIDLLRQMVKDYQTMKGMLL